MKSKGVSRSVEDWLSLQSRKLLQESRLRVLPGSEIIAVTIASLIAPCSNGRKNASSDKASNHGLKAFSTDTGKQIAVGISH